MNRISLDKNIELENCYFAKTVLMLLVVLYHSGVFWTGEWFDCEKVKIESVGVSIFSQYLNTFHIYGFTLISGYVYSYIKKEKGGYSQYKSFVFNKVKRLLVPYYFALIWVVPLSCHFYSISGIQFVKDYLLANNPSQLWFLWMLFDIFILIWPISELLKNDLIAILVCSISYLLGVVGKLLLPNIFCIWTALNYLPFFVIGMKIRERNEWIVQKIPPLFYIIIDIILFAMRLYIQEQSGMIMKIIGFGLNTALHLLGALMSFFVLQEVANRYAGWKNSRVFRLLSQYTMPVYLFHQQLIYFFIIIFNGKVSPCINMLINFMGSFSISLIISVLLMKSNITRVLLGEKIQSSQVRK